MDYELLVKVLQMYGFPAAMCFWFMWRLEKRLDAIEATNHRQVVVMAVLVRVLVDRKSIDSIPGEFIDNITGVNELPLPGDNGKPLEGKAP